jgi:carbamoylphosphate synthase small subunit
VVFNTALTGYQEILSDPSYIAAARHLTYPHIGNVGTNDDDMESRRAYAAGLIVRDVPAPLEQIGVSALRSAIFWCARMWSRSPISTRVA